jgi:hypothetical protein
MFIFVDVGKDVRRDAGRMLGVRVWTHGNGACAVCALLQAAHVLAHVLDVALVPPGRAPRRRRRRARGGQPGNGAAFNFTYVSRASCLSCFLYIGSLSVSILRVPFAPCRSGGSWRPMRLNRGHVRDLTASLNPRPEEMRSLYVPTYYTFVRFASSRCVIVKVR